MCVLDKCLSLLNLDWIDSLCCPFYFFQVLLIRELECQRPWHSKPYGCMDKTMVIQAEDGRAEYVGVCAGGVLLLTVSVSRRVA